MTIWFVGEDKDAKEFRDILTGFAKGSLTVPQWEKLKTRDIELMPPAERAAFEETAVYICAKNDDVMRHNLEGIAKCNADVAPISALHTGKGKYTSMANGGGLPKETVLCKGARVRLLSNEWKEAGKQD